MNGELLQGLYQICNKGLRKPANFRSAGAPHPRNLTHPYLLVTFRLKPFFSGI